MQRLSVDTTAVADYGGTTALMAEQLAAAGAEAAAATPALLVPVFGLIGADFVAAFAEVQSAHVASIAQLTTVVGAISTSAVGTATEYAGTDATVGADVNSAGTTRQV